MKIKYIIYKNPFVFLFNNNLLIGFFPDQYLFDCL